MVFRSKIDAFYVKFVIISLLIVNAVMLMPLFLVTDINQTLIVRMLLLTFFISLFLIWSCFSIKYVFHKNYLLVKGGLLRSKIPYHTMTKIAPTNEIFSGYKLLSAKDAIELFYQQAVFGSVKVSPREKTRFITELKKRCPHIIDLTE